MTATGSELSKIRVLCVDDHRLVRDGLVLILGQEPDIEVVAAAESGEQAVEYYRHYRPDVALMDLRLGKNLSGIDAIRTIRHEFPDARIVAVTMYRGEEDIYKALEAGAMAYLSKDTVASALVRTVRQLHAGEQPVTPDIAQRLAQRRAHPTLSSREIQVLELMARGMRNKEIAACLLISRGTVNNHLKHIFSKLDVNDRNAALYVAVQRGLVHFD